MTLVSGTALGQPFTPPEVEPPAPLYQVEVLIFANRDFDPSEERFSQELTPLPREQDASLREVPVFDDTNFSPFPQPAPAAPALPSGAGTNSQSFGDTPVDSEPGFRLLRPDELQLNAEYRKLQNLSAYVALLHTGWVQPGLSEEQSEPVDLARTGTLNPRGSVRVYLSRFLHINLDLTYEDTRAGNLTTPAFGGQLGEIGLAPRYRLVTQRQARSGELHFFDHPAFGVLVRITPVPAATPEAGSGRSPAA